MCVLFLCIISGNTAVLVIIFLTRKLRSRMNIFMANLAIAGNHGVLFTHQATLLLNLILTVANLFKVPHALTLAPYKVTLVFSSTYLL